MVTQLKNLKFEDYSLKGVENVDGCVTFGFRTGDKLCSLDSEGCIGSPIIENNGDHWYFSGQCEYAQYSNWAEYLGNPYSGWQSYDGALMYYSSSGCTTFCYPSVVGCGGCAPTYFIMQHGAVGAIMDVNGCVYTLSVSSGQVTATVVH
jgi:hypothetical protein